MANDLGVAVESPIGIAHSELQGCRRDDGVFVVRLRSWNNKTLDVAFPEVIAVKAVLAGDFSALLRDAPASQTLLKAALRRNFEKVPSGHPYQVYSFLNGDDEPSLEVVATNCEVSVVAGSED